LGHFVDLDLVVDGDVNFDGDGDVVRRRPDLDVPAGPCARQHLLDPHRAPALSSRAGL